MKIAGFGLLGEWFSRRSAKAFTRVRFSQRPHKVIREDEKIRNFHNFNFFTLKMCGASLWLRAMHHGKLRKNLWLVRK